MALFLALPFFITTIIMGFWAKKHPAEILFNRFLLIALVAMCLIPSLLTQQLNFAESSLVGSLASLYIANLFTNKYLTKIFEICSLAFMLFAGYSFNLSAVNLACITTFILVAYYGLINYKHEVALSMVHIIPLGAAALYFNSNNLGYMLTFMALFGCGRYFVENKVSVMPNFYLQSFLALLMFNLITTEDLAVTNNIIILLSGLSVIIVTKLLETILRGKKTIISRLFDQTEIRFLVTIKILAFNVIALALAFAYSLNYISIYILIAYIIIAFTYTYAKMWYIENEDKFKY